MKGSSTTRWNRKYAAVKRQEPSLASGCYRRCVFSHIEPYIQDSAGKRSLSKASKHAPATRDKGWQSMQAAADNTKWQQVDRMRQQQPDRLTRGAKLTKMARKSEKAKLRAPTRTSA